MVTGRAHDVALSRHYGCAMTVVAAAARATRHRGANIAAVAGPAALALALALVRTTQIPLWRDEFATALFASLPPADLLAATTRVDAVLTPYYFVMHLLSPVLGLGLGMRIVSIVAFVGTTAVTAAVALRWWGAIGGSVTGLALALNGEVLGAAVNARPYALSLFFGAVALFAADRALRSGRTWTWAGYAAAAMAAVALQLFAVVAIAVIGVLTVGRPRATLARWVLWSLPTGVIAVVLLAVGLGHRDQLAWLGESDVRETIRLIAHASGVSADRAVAVDAITLASFVIAAALSLVVARRLPSADYADASRTRAFAVTLALAPPLILFALSIAITPVFAGKYFIWSAIGAALVLAGAVVLLKETRTAPAVTAGLIALALLMLSTVVAGIRMVDPPPRGDDFPAAVRTLEQSAETGDTFVIAQPYAFGGVAYGFAVSAADDAHAAEVADRVVSGAQPVLDVRTITSTDPLRTTDAEAAPSVLTEDTTPNPSTWVMTIFPITDAQLETVDPAIAGCVRSLDFESPTERFGALRLYRLECG